MRMQSVDMEFVTFDARDVITTSADTYFYLNGNGVYYHATDDTYADRGAEKGKTYRSGGIEENSYITGLYPGNSFFTAFNNNYIAFDTELLPNDGNIYVPYVVDDMSLEAVLEWLKNGPLQKQ